MLPSTRFLNIGILSITQYDLLANLTKGVLITPNVDHLVKLQRDKELYNIYQQAEWVVCDSKILWILSKLLKQSLPETIPGSSFFRAFYQYHKSNKNCKIFLLGAAEGVAAKAMQEINTAMQRNIIIGALSPSYGFEKNEEECKNIIKTIRKSGANVLVVGVGAPKQEKWIARYREKLPEIDIFMGLGATIDFEAKNLKRAPIFLQKMGLEWFYRFIKEPKRLFKRYFIDDIKFFIYFGKQLLGIYKNPFRT